MKRVVLVAVFIVLAVIPLGHAAAYDAFQGFKGKEACGGSAQGSAVCSTNGTNTITGPTGVLRKATNIIALLAGIAAVILIVLSGFQFITSGGDAQKIAGARNTLFGAIIGVVIVIAAQGILQFVLKAT